MRTWIGDVNAKEGQSVELYGWVHTLRSHGKINFIDLRDRSGIVQVVLTADVLGPEPLSTESVVKIEGMVKRRPENMVNAKQANGQIEVEAKKLEILNYAAGMPIPIDTDGHEINEESRLKYRYLDLRRERLKNNLVKRHEVIRFFRNYLSKKGFVEVETPLLTKSTPEGARDYIVPSRIQKGSFYALPQSPQQYKQLLMVAGVEKYFQIARALRDEDTRGDRQPEHTQLDIEMSFVKSKDVMSLVEKMVIKMVREIYPKKKMKTPWPRINYKDAMAKYGNDKPDLRENKNDVNELAFAWVVNFPSFELDVNTKAIQPVHHMFVEPQPKSVHLIDKDPLKMISTQYDWVCNGLELASGSIRITDPELQLKVFKLLGMSEEKARRDFGHMLEAFTYGVPPHGGIAPGIDRLLMILQGEPNIREVIAFPKTGDGRDPMMGSPAPVDKKQLDELGLEIKKTE